MSDEWETMESAKNFWSPKAKGEEIQGEVVEITQGMYGSKYVIKTATGDWTTPSHKVLQSKLSGAIIGDIVKITYDGEIPPRTRGENPTKIYIVQKKKVTPAVTEQVQ